MSEGMAHDIMFLIAWFWLVPAVLYVIWFALRRF